VELKRLSVQWTANIKDKKEKEEFVKYVHGSSGVLERLEDILDSKVNASRPTLKDYELASWPYYEADRNGYNRALEEILELITLEK